MLITVKNWIKISHNRIFLSVLFILIILIVIAPISENPLLLIFTKSLIVPVFLLYYFIRNKFIGLALIAFLVFSFLGDSASVLFNENSIIKFSSVAYCISYLCLVSIVLSKFKLIVFDKIIGLYLLIIFSINAYFLYILFTILQAVIPDGLEVVLFGIKSISLLILALIAFAVYLNSDTKQSIIFLVMSLCLVFSDVLYYISYYYIYDWSFVMLDRILHVVALFFLFNYIFEQNRSRKKLMLHKRLVSSDNALA